MIGTVARLLVAVVRDLAIAIMRRVLCGPIVREWSWGVELRVVAFRSFLEHSSVMPGMRHFVETRLDPPIPRQLRGLINVESGVVGGVPGEWITRSDFDDTVVLLYLHGGAYVGGNPATHRQLACRLTWAFGTRTFVPDYRLAPDHRFPAALDDAVAAYQGLETTDVIVAGDSAGGGLACALMLRLRDEEHRLPIGAVLFSPYTDLEHTAPSILANAATDYLPRGTTTPNVVYLGDHDPKDPLASPMYGDFTGIPPLLVMAGGREMILDDARRLVDKARSDGANVTLYIEPDMMHVWPAIVPDHPAASRAIAVATDFVKGLEHRHVSDAPPSGS